MSRRIGKRTREAAIHCLEQCASDRIGGVRDTSTDDVESGAAFLAASCAWFEAASLLPGMELRGAIDYLEAAALLRDGWNPGDPVEVRR